MSKFIHDLSGLLGIINGRLFQLKKSLNECESFSKKDDILEKFEKLSKDVDRVIEFLNKEKGNSNE